MLGVFILFTAALSGVSMFFMAGYITTDPIACILMSSAWALFIFSIDRYLAISITSFKAHIHEGDQQKSSHPGDDNKSRNFTPAHNASPGYLMAIITRLIAAIFLSIVISIPVKLALFEPDINGQLAIDNRNATTDFFTTDPQLAALKVESQAVRNRIKSLRAEIQHAEQRLAERYQQMKDESYGKGGSNQKGFGPYYEQAKAAYLQAKSSWETTEQTNRLLIQSLASNDAEIQQKIQNQTQAKAQQASDDDGLLNRYKALTVLAANNPQINLTLWLISLLFIFIEAFPVFTKASQKRDSYEKLLIALALEEQPRHISEYLAEQEALLAKEINDTPFVVPNHYRVYLIMFGIALCALFPFFYEWMNGASQVLTPTLIFYMFSPLAIILVFISAEMLVLRSRALWQSLKPAEDLNFTLQALTILLAPLAVLLYLGFNPEPNLLSQSALIVDTRPILEHASFWGSWVVSYILLLVLVVKHDQGQDASNEPARQKQISEIEQKQRCARQAYRRSCLSLYSLTGLCATCGFLLYARLPANATHVTFWQLQGLLSTIPFLAVIFYGMGVRIPITTLLSIANSHLKRAYTVSVIFFSVTAAGMCLALLANRVAAPALSALQETTAMQTPRFQMGIPSESGNQGKTGYLTYERMDGIVQPRLH
jgi:hypothetical protein